MAITPMWRCTRIAAGVAGAPYYYTAYFDSVAGTPTQAMTAWSTFLNTTIPGTYRSGLQWQAATDVEQVDPVTGDLQGLFPVTFTSTTATGTDPLPSATALLARWRTGVYLGGKEVRGRTNISGLLERDNVNGVPGGADVAAFSTRAAALIADPNSELVVWSRKAGQHFAVANSSISPEWAVLRSRRD